MRFGLQNETIDQIRSVFARHPEVRQAILYGSRAMGTQRDGSDIDLTLTGKALNLQVLTRIETELDDLLLPHKIDLSIRRQINNDSLLNHIERVGVLFYDRECRSDADRPGASMKKGWKTATLGAACRFIDYRGKTPTKIEAGLRLITAKNVKMGFVQREPLEYVSPDSYDGWMTRGIPKFGDVLFTTEAPLANVAQLDTDERVVFAQRIIVLQPTDESLDRTFLKYQLLSDILQDRIRENGTGATVQGIKASLLKAIEINVPPLAEQQRIVGILDEAFEGIATAKANAEQNLQNARALFESHRQSVFTQRGEGWEETTLGEIAQFKNGLNYNRNSSGQTLPVVGVSDFQDNYYVPLSEVEPATIDGLLDEGYALRRDDMLTVRSNGSKHLVGRCMLVPEVDETTSYSGSIIRIRFDAKQLYPKFLLHFMKCQTTRDTLTKGGGGANITNINQEKLSALLVSFPPHFTQVKIAAELDSLGEETQRLAIIYERKLAALDDLKKSLLHQAFSGKL